MGLWDRVKSAGASLRDATVATVRTVAQTIIENPMMISNPALAVVASTPIGRALRKGVEHAAVDAVTAVTGAPEDVYRSVTRMRGQERSLGMMSSDEQSAAVFRAKERVTGRKEEVFAAGSAASYAENVGYWGGTAASLVVGFGGMAVRGGARLIGNAPRIASLGEKLLAGDRLLAGGSSVLAQRTLATAGLVALAPAGMAFVEPVVGALTEGSGKQVAAAPASAAPAAASASATMASDANTSPPRVASRVPQSLTAAHTPEIKPLKASLNAEDRQTVEDNIVAQVTSPDFLKDAQSGAFDHTRIEALQSMLVQTGRMSATHNTGTVNQHMMRAIDSTLRDVVKPETLTVEQRQEIFENSVRIYQDLHEHPPAASGMDPRVMAFQTNTSLLGLYTGRIDGISGVKTIGAAHGIETMAQQHAAAQAQPVAPVTETAAATAEPRVGEPAQPSIRAVSFGQATPSLALN